MSEYSRYLIDIGHYDITPEQEKEIEAREECARRGIDPDELCADGGVEAWMVVAKEMEARAPAYHAPDRICPVCGGKPHVCDCPIFGDPI